jgi:hypothetical protein
VRAATGAESPDENQVTRAQLSERWGPVARLIDCEQWPGDGSILAPPFGHNRHPHGIRRRRNPTVMQYGKELPLIGGSRDRG